jgi:hypothetical protein
MSKAEDRSLEAYPKETRDITGFVVDIGYPQYMRNLYIEGYHQAEKDHQQIKELLKMLLEEIDCSFKQTDGTYDLTLTYPVIDKVKYIKQKLRENI